MKQKSYNYKFIIGIIIGILLVTSVSAAGNIVASSIAYDSTNGELSTGDIQGAIDDLASKIESPTSCPDGYTCTVDQPSDVIYELSGEWIFNDVIDFNPSFDKDGDTMVIAEISFENDSFNYSEIAVILDEQYYDLMYDGYSMYYDGWYESRFLNFGTTSQPVSQEFYEWFTANANPPTESNAGLYDANDNLLADWDTLVNNYGLDVSKDYSFNFTTAKGCPNYILNNNTELSTGVKWVIGNGVERIGVNAFRDCEALTNIVLPDSLKSIGEYAFWGTNITSIVIPDRVTIIDESAFEECANLTSIVIPDSVISIGRCAFRYCDNLTNVTIGSGVTSIGTGAFSYCAKLTSVTFLDTSTWYYTSNSYTSSDGTQVDVTNPSTAATYLTSTYNNRNWYKE